MGNFYIVLQHHFVGCNHPGETKSIFKVNTKFHIALATSIVKVYMDWTGQFSGRLDCNFLFRQTAIILSGDVIWSFFAGCLA